MLYVALETHILARFVDAGCDLRTAIAVLAQDGLRRALLVDDDTMIEWIRPQLQTVLD